MLDSEVKECRDAAMAAVKSANFSTKCYEIYPDVIFLLYNNNCSLVIVENDCFFINSCSDRPYGSYLVEECINVHSKGDCLRLINMWKNTTVQDDTETDEDMW